MSYELHYEDVLNAFTAAQEYRPSRFIMPVHPRELWWFELTFNGGRTKAFKAFWWYRKLFTDTEIMNALSKIIKGNPLR